ncbi:MAG: hypothetical protein ACK4F8_11100 [Aquabacterium sp.]
MDLQQLNDHGAYHEAKRLILGGKRRAYAVLILAFTGDMAVSAGKAAIATAVIAFWALVMYWDGPFNIEITDTVRQLCVTLFFVLWTGMMVMGLSNSILNRHIQRVADMITAKNLAVNEIKDQA